MFEEYIKYLYTKKEVYINHKRELEKIEMTDCEEYKELCYEISEITKKILDI